MLFQALFYTTLINIYFQITNTRFTVSKFFIVLRIMLFCLLLIQSIEIFHIYALLYIIKEVPPIYLPRKQRSKDNLRVSP